MYVCVASEPLNLPGLEPYVDPEGIFKLKVPSGWFTKRKGDKDREGLIFISGDFRQAVTIAVETLHVKALFRGAGRAYKLPTSEEAWRGAEGFSVCFG